MMKKKFSKYSWRIVFSKSRLAIRLERVKQVFLGLTNARN